MSNSNKRLDKNFDKALLCLEEEKINPKDSYGYFNTGSMLRLNKKYEEAIEAFNMAIKLIHFEAVSFLKGTCLYIRRRN